MKEREKEGNRRDEEGNTVEEAEKGRREGTTEEWRTLSAGQRRRQVRESSSVGDDIPDGHSTSSSSTGSDSDTMTGEEPGRSRPQHHSQLPALFREDIDDADGVACEVCRSTGPEGLSSSTVFWIDCDVCGVWVHNYCVFQKHDVGHKYVCNDCSANSHRVVISLMMCWSVCLCISIA